MNHFLLFFRFFLLELLRLGVVGDFELDLDLFDLCFRFDLELSLSSDEAAYRKTVYRIQCNSDALVVTLSALPKVCKYQL